MKNAKAVPKPPFVTKVLSSEEHLRKIVESLRRDSFYAIANEIESEWLYGNAYSKRLLVTLLRSR